MGWSGILFNPQGRISSAEFWRGIVILVGVYLVSTVASAYASFGLSMILGFVPILIMYPLLCVYGKRFHDSGRTAWLSVLVFFGFWTLSIIANQILVPILAPEFMVFQTELSEKFANGEVDFMEMMEQLGARASDVLVVSIISTMVAALIPAFLVGRLISDPDENEHGMPTGGSLDGTFD